MVVVFFLVEMHHYKSVLLYLEGCCQSNIGGWLTVIVFSHGLLLLELFFLHQCIKMNKII